MTERRETVLIEHADGATRWTLERTLRREGFDVVNCPGPGDHRYRDCPVLRGDPCELIDRADRVLNGVPGRAGDRLLEVQRRAPYTEVRRLDSAPSHRGRPHSSDRQHLLAVLGQALRRRGHADGKPSGGRV